MMNSLTKFILPLSGRIKGNWSDGVMECWSDGCNNLTESDEGGTVRV